MTKAQVATHKGGVEEVFYVSSTLLTMSYILYVGTCMVISVCGGVVRGMWGVGVWRGVVRGMWGGVVWMGGWVVVVWLVVVWLVCARVHMCI